MKFCGIDLHSNNSVVVVTDEADKVLVREKRGQGKKGDGKRGQIYLIFCYAESFHGGGIKYAQDGTYCFTELPASRSAARP
ncbi:hypothetical protein SAMN03159304_05944 [Pseudomonas sp. NFACC24-1]|nr:hypothetical protein SAMN03159304_05944 [Pseudomonas sp. NFACC24-1]